MADERLTVEELRNWRKKKNEDWQRKNASLEINEENKMLLREILAPEKIEILSEDKTKSGDTINIRVPFLEVDKKTKNGRIYSEWLMKRELGKVQKTVESGGFLGMSDHPESGLGTVKDASHIVEKLELDEAGIGWADLKILSTSKGKDIQTIIRENGRLGVSMRGAGTVSKDTGQVQGDYTFLGLDVVLNPSVENAMFDKSNIVESEDFQEPNMPSEEIIQFVLDGVFGQRQDRGSKETYEEFLKEHGTAIKADILVEHGVYPNIETALIKMGREDVLREMKSEEKVKVWDESELFWEARTAGVSPKDLCKKLNEAEQRKKIDRDSGFSEEEARKLIDEAERAGVSMKNLEKRKAYLESLWKNRTPSEKTIHEQAILLDKKMVAEGKESNIPFIEEVLRHDAREAETQKKRMAVKAMVEGEILRAGAFVSREETHKHVNRELRKRGLKILDEDGQ